MEQVSIVITAITISDYSRLCVYKTSARIATDNEHRCYLFSLRQQPLRATLSRNNYHHHQAVNKDRRVKCQRVKKVSMITAITVTITFDIVFSFAFFRRRGQPNHKTSRCHHHDHHDYHYDHHLHIIIKGVITFTTTTAMCTHGNH